VSGAAVPAAQIAAVRFKVAALRLRVALAADTLQRRYNPNWASQPRVPAGNRDGGRWTDDNGPAIALNDWGTLLAEIPVRGGRECVYRFDTFSIIVVGPASFPCQDRVLWSAVTHGQLLNDN
jgi:hypothetical protein